MKYTELDELGIPVRLGLDPQMRMEEGSADGGEPSGDPAAPAGDPPADPAAPAAPADPPADPDPAGSDKWDPATRKYIEDLRQENGKQRQRASRFEETFKEWPDDAVDGFLGLATRIANNDPAAAPVLEELLTQLTPKQQEELKQAVEEIKTDETPPIFKTQEELDAYLQQRDDSKQAERDKAAEEEKVLTALKTEITELGFNLDTPNEDANLLFFFAGKQEGEGPKDWKAASEEVAAYKQSLIDEYVGKVAGRNSRWTKVARNDGATPLGDDGGKKTLGVANGNSKRALAAYLESIDNN